MSLEAHTACIFFSFPILIMVLVGILAGREYNIKIKMIDVYSCRLHEESDQPKKDAVG